MSENEHDIQAWAKAQMHFSEARVLDPQKSPASLVHAGYYSMFYAARACLLRQTGSAPKKHNDVIRQFGFLVNDGDAGLRQAGDGLNKVWDMRVTADYRDTSKVTSAEASEALQRASGFLDLCQRRFGF
jgi:uncharacterized protein (UPF0332 family)